MAEHLGGLQLRRLIKATSRRALAREAMFHAIHWIVGNLGLEVRTHEVNKQVQGLDPGDGKQSPGLDNLSLVRFASLNALRAE